MPSTAIQLEIEKGQIESVNLEKSLGQKTGWVEPASHSSERMRKGELIQQ